MSHRELQVTVLSAQDLKNVRLSGRTMNPYAEAWIRKSSAMKAREKGREKVRTGVDSGGGINPEWNYVLKLSCEEELFRGDGALTIALRNRGALCNRLIGTATIPLSDLSLQCRAADSNASRETTLMSYQVRMRSGKIRGVLHIAVLVGSLVKQGAAVTGHSQAAPPSNFRQYSQSNSQYYPPQQVYPSQRNAYPLQQSLYPQSQPHYAQPAAYSTQQVAY